MRVLNLITATICLSLVCTACGRGIERRSVVKTGKIQEIVDGNVEVVKSKIVALFKAKYEARVEGESDIYQNQDDIYSSLKPATKEAYETHFPSDLALMAWERAYEHLEAGNLSEYLKLSEHARKDDICLMNFDLRFWYSEYYWNGKPAKFKCNFIVHLEPNGGNQTTIQIYQYQPQIWIGKKYGMGHAGPAYTNDMRWVEPTAKDSLELLSFIKGNVRQ